MSDQPTKLTQADIINLLKTNDTAVGRAIVQLYRRQTKGEQSNASTQEHNARGFNGVHAYMGTKLAEYYLNKGYLTPGQLEWARHPTGKSQIPRIGIYARQLLEIAEEVSATRAARTAGQKQAELLEPAPEQAGSYPARTRSGPISVAEHCSQESGFPLGSIQLTDYINRYYGHG